MDKKPLIFAWSFMAVAIGIWAYSKFKIKQQIPLANSFSRTKVDGITITKPDNDSRKYNVIYIFGGMSYATADWMQKQVPKNYFLTNILVFANYTDSFSEANAKLKQFIAENNLQQGDVSIMGFSAGALPVLDNYSQEFKFVGLIDPSNRDKHLNLKYGSNAYMLYNSANWGTYPNIQSNMKKIAAKISDAGGVASKTTLSHKLIPAYFFKNVQSVHLK